RPCSVCCMSGEPTQLPFSIRPQRQMLYKRQVHIPPRYFIRTPYNGVLASQTRHDYCPQSSMIRGVMSPGLVGRW
ncbi:hypothetical protein, partial [Shigella sonnei]|uniref:hypothetical protein n=1 Tax=Shigella sonnei TaxID=624 RepID=UPI001C0A6FA3